MRDIEMSGPDSFAIGLLIGWAVWGFALLVAAGILGNLAAFGIEWALPRSTWLLIGLDGLAAASIAGGWIGYRLWGPESE